MNQLNYKIREIKESEYHLLDYFLYEAIYVPEGVEAPPASIIHEPGLQCYVSHFGEFKDDRALVAQAGGDIAGVVWVRIMNDYGHIDDDTPSFAISIRKEYRGLGIGTRLMEAMLALLKNCGYKRASLSVQKANYAVKMYHTLGFKVVDENSEEYIMAYDFTEPVRPCCV